MRDKEKIIINDYIQGDPLSEENLDKTLNFLHKIRLSCPNKTIWIYSGYEWKDIWSESNIVINDYTNQVYENYKKRQQIISMCDVMIDGRYIDTQRNVSAKWKGSDNQNVIDIKKSLEEGTVVLYCD